MHISQSAELSQHCCTQVSMQLLTSWPMGLRNHKKVSSHQQLKTFVTKTLPKTWRGGFSSFRKLCSLCMVCQGENWYSENTLTSSISWLNSYYFRILPNSPLGKISLQDERSCPRNFLQPRLSTAQSDTIIPHPCLFTWKEWDFS